MEDKELLEQILPDEEDLTLSCGVLKFKDRQVNPAEHTGKGYKILRLDDPNCPTGKYLESTDFLNSDTIYEIRYDFDLNNDSITIPENCVLHFKGGSFSNGTIVGNNTIIIGYSTASFNNVVFQGTFNTDALSIDWNESDKINATVTDKTGNKSPLVNALDIKAEATATTVEGEASASVEVVDGVFKFSFSLPKGDTGEDGETPAVSRNATCYKESDTQPLRPQGGSWNVETDEIIYPIEWSETPEGMTSIIWMSTGRFNQYGNLVCRWSEPVRITGPDGRPGEDGNGIEFIYTRTEEEIAPEKPTESQNTNGYVPAGWYNHPTGVDSIMICEWFCSRNKIDDTWSDWSTPGLWAKYGQNGIDGDGVEYIFKRTKDNIRPSTPVSQNQEDFIPEGWEDNPIGVDEEWMYEWVCKRKYSGETKTWGLFSTPAIWAKFGKDGEDGVGEDGTVWKIYYSKTSSVDEEPVIVKNEINPGSNWSSTVPKKEKGEAVWATNGQFTTKNTLVGEWSDPYLISGIDGEPGATGTPPNWYTYVYYKSESKPSQPTGNDPSNPGDGWVDYPDSSGQWWQCVGLVDGATNLVIQWGEVLALNGGQPGEDGRYVEFRFATSVDGRAPSLNIYQLEPDGWYINPPGISEGETLWMTSATFNADGSFSNMWSTPVRISGEQGLKGDTGPIGPEGPPGADGVSGVPGVSFDILYSLGTVDEPDADHTEANLKKRNPDGWLKDLPAATEEKPYIWCIQGRINYDDTLEDGKWQGPIKLSGTNGLNGKPGGNQIPYPAGIYDLNTVYECTDQKAPYVFDTVDNNFWILNTIMSWKGADQDNKYPHEAPETWTKLESFEAVYAKVGIIANGLIGSMVFNDNFVFSMQGVGDRGLPTTYYELFDKEFPMGPHNLFRPNYLLDCETGEMWLGAGSSYFAQDGSGHLAGGNISWDAEGNLTLTGNITDKSNQYYDVIQNKAEVLLQGNESHNMYIIPYLNNTSSNLKAYYTEVILNMNQTMDNQKYTINLKCPNDSYYATLKIKASSINKIVCNGVEVKYIYLKEQDCKVDLFITKEGSVYTATILNPTDFSIIYGFEDNTSIKNAMIKPYTMGFGTNQLLYRWHFSGEKDIKVLYDSTNTYSGPPYQEACFQDNVFIMPVAGTRYSENNYDFEFAFYQGQYGDVSNRITNRTFTDFMIKHVYFKLYQPDEFNDRYTMDVVPKYDLTNSKIILGLTRDMLMPAIIEMYYSSYELDGRSYE